MGEVTVHGMIGSPFVRSVLVALEEKGQAYRLVPLKLQALQSPEYRALHPFGRVPVFEQDGFQVYETQAILRHIDRAWPKPGLTPRGLAPAARMDQILNTIDAYLFAGAGEVLGRERILAPRFLKRASDEHACVAAGEKVGQALGVLARLFGDKPFLTGPDLTLADIALGCHLDFLALTPEGERAIGAQPPLDAWRGVLSRRASFESTTIARLAERFWPKRG